MDYRLDDLGWQQFERLVQALLKARLGIAVEAWGGTADDGVDAYCLGPLSYPGPAHADGPFIFQCKFVEGANAAGANPRTGLLGAVRKEAGRIRTRVQGGSPLWSAPRHYSLLTNAPVSASTHRSITSIIQGALPGCVVHIQSGKDVSAWLDDAPDIRKSFPQLVAPADVERARIKGSMAEGTRLANAGKSEEAAERFRDALRTAELLGWEQEQADAHLDLGLLAANRDDVADARGHLAKAQALLTGASPARHLDALRLATACCAKSGELDGEEVAYREALDYAETNGLTDTDAGRLTQMEYVRYLCCRGRAGEAEPLVRNAACWIECPPADADPTVVCFLVEVGLGWAVFADRPEQFAEWLVRAESVAVDATAGLQLGGHLVGIANMATHRQQYEHALSCARLAARLAKAAGNDSLSLGAIHTMIRALLFQGDATAAMELWAASIDAVRASDDRILIGAFENVKSEIALRSGATADAVDMAERALARSGGEALASCVLKVQLARACFVDGRVRDALAHSSDAGNLARELGLPWPLLEDALLVAVEAAALLGERSSVAQLLAQIESHPPEGADQTEHRANVVQRVRAYEEIRDRLGRVAADQERAAAPDIVGAATVCEANAAVYRPLLDWWAEAPGEAASLYDMWGRGNLWQMLLNLGAQPNGMHVMQEVRSLADVERAIRLWTMVADVLVLLWKGETVSGWGHAVVPGDRFGIGGHGYILALGTQLAREGSDRPWFLAMRYASLLPEEVANYLATECKPLLEMGKLLLLPASGVGCIHHGHGPLETVFAGLCHATPSVRAVAGEGQLIGAIPYFHDVPLAALADIIGENESALRSLRVLLAQRSRGCLDPDTPAFAKTLALEIDDGLKRLRSASRALARRHGWTEASEAVHAGQIEHSLEDAFRESAAVEGSRRMFPFLSDDLRLSPFTPILQLTGLGYRWRVERAVPSATPSVPYTPGEGEAVGAWLCPPTPGWSILAVKKPEDT